MPGFAECGSYDNGVLPTGVAPVRRRKPPAPQSAWYNQRRLHSSSDAVRSSWKSPNSGVGTVALAATASERRDCRHENPPPSPQASPSICLLRLPLPTRRDRAGGPLVPTLGLSYRDVEELLVERGVEVDHVTIYRWVLRFTPLLADAARPCRHAVGDRWQVDETYVKVAGQWRYVYRAIDQFGQIIDVFVSARRDADAACQFFERAIGTTKLQPVEVVTDRAPTYPVALEELLPAAWHRTDQYANNGIECDHGQLKARLRPMRGAQAGPQRQGDHRRACVHPERPARALRADR
jgi:IS6 family transposase